MPLSTSCSHNADQVEVTRGMLEVGQHRSCPLHQDIKVWNLSWCHDANSDPTGPRPFQGYKTLNQSPLPPIIFSLHCPLRSARLGLLPPHASTQLCFTAKQPNTLSCLLLCFLSLDLFKTSINQLGFEQSHLDKMRCDSQDSRSHNAHTGPPSSPQESTPDGIFYWATQMFWCVFASGPLSWGMLLVRACTGSNEAK